MPRTHIRTLPLSSRPGIPARVGQIISTLLARRRDRQALARLDPHLLRDIGLSPDEAAAEHGKPFWRD